MRSVFGALDVLGVAVRLGGELPFAEPITNDSNAQEAELAKLLNV